MPSDSIPRGSPFTLPLGMTFWQTVLATVTAAALIGFAGWAWSRRRVVARTAAKGRRHVATKRRDALLERVIAEAKRRDDRKPISKSGAWPVVVKWTTGADTYYLGANTSDAAFVDYRRRFGRPTHTFHADPPRTLSEWSSRELRSYLRDKPERRE